LVDKPDFLEKSGLFFEEQNINENQFNAYFMNPYSLELHTNKIFLNTYSNQIFFQTTKETRGAQ